jgi:hypothetical protein
MPLISPTNPSAITAVRPSSLQPTQNNRAFYVYSGEVDVDENETTAISIADIGKRDIFIAFEVGSDTLSSDDIRVRFKVNGENIYVSKNPSAYVGGNQSGYDELRMIIPANTSLEVTLQNVTDNSTLDFYVAGYGNYLE